MNRKILAFLTLMATVLTILAGFLISTAVNHSLREALQSSLRENLQGELSLATKAVREALLLGDVRYARNTLTSLAEHKVFYAYIISKGDTVIESENLLPTSDGAQIITEIPVYFDDTGGSKWGSIRFETSTEHIESILKKVDRWLWLLIVTLASLVLTFFATAFFALTMSASWLSPVLENYLRNGELVEDIASRVGEFSKRLYSPLLSTLEQTSARLTMFRKEAESARVAKAIAGMTQLVAHDVRAPLTMVKMFVKLLEDTNNPEDIRSLTLEVMPEIERSIDKVTGILSDILEIDSQRKPVREKHDPGHLARDLLRDVLKEHGGRIVQTELMFRHTQNVCVDFGKISRVFANVIGNALLLMPEGSRLWIHTRDVLQNNEPSVEFTIGNSGTSIPQEELVQLFDAFYSKRKGGTGLGLAIAQKVVTEHSGSIRAQSTADSVEFVFVLPSVS